ncbi:MAG: GNAT family N-acetyltransferase [Flavobacterium sp.]|uniref:GNAT family N-acetyltransferase n=1 Tax=Flavobacterium sp. TaxID=239 RepID=UPI00352759ED
MITLKRYHSNDKIVWDNFINLSRINTFLFKRDFIEYHSDRFEDFSILIYRKGKLEAVLPGNVKGTLFYSHQGLTYGGLVTSSKITAIEVMIIFEELSKFLKENNISEVFYKPTPLIYHKQPMQEDIYALYRLKADKISCTLSSTIFLDNKIPFTESRKSGIRKAQKSNVIVKTSDDFKSFWEILDYNLTSNHGVKPVHSLEEILRLKDLFPENIKLISSNVKGKMIAGTVLFIMGNLIHVQYISASYEGKQLGALDLLFDEIINNLYKSFLIIDFGHSNEDSGNYLNERLIFQKEGFGGRGVVYEIYHYKI